MKTEFFDALTTLAPSRAGTTRCSTRPPPGCRPGCEDVARRIVRLIEQPEAAALGPAAVRLAVPAARRPCSRSGPSLGDRAVSSVVRHYDAIDPRMNPTTQTRRAAQGMTSPNSMRSVPLDDLRNLARDLLASSSSATPSSPPVRPASARRWRRRGRTAGTAGARLARHPRSAWRRRARPRWRSTGWSIAGSTR